MICSLTLLSTADESALFRANPSFLSQQSRMELLVADFTPEEFYDSTGDFLDISKWPGVNLEEQEVKVIDWMGAAFGSAAEIYLQWLPESLMLCRLDGMGVTGTVSTSGLPRDLRFFNIGKNRLSGPFETAPLPLEITILIMDANEFSGTLNIATLPPKLAEFNARENRFSGTLDFGSLPVTLKELWLNSNAFSGSIDLRHLPPSLGLLFLCENAFSQDELVVGSNTVMLRHEGGNSFGQVVDMEGKPYPG